MAFKEHYLPSPKRFTESGQIMFIRHVQSWNYFISLLGTLTCNVTTCLPGQVHRTSYIVTSLELAPAPLLCHRELSAGQLTAMQHVH